MMSVAARAVVEAPRPMNSGWAGRTLRQALSNAALAGSVAAQVLLVAATVIAPLDGSDAYFRRR